MINGRRNLLRTICVAALVTVLPEAMRSGVPAWYGAMIGHNENTFTVPLRIGAEIEAGRGTIHLLESAVE